MMKSLFAILALASCWIGPAFASPIELRFSRTYSVGALRVFEGPTVSLPDGSSYPLAALDDAKLWITNVLPLCDLASGTKDQSFLAYYKLGIGTGDFAFINPSTGAHVIQSGTAANTISTIYCLNKAQYTPMAQESLVDLGTTITVMRPLVPMPDGSLLSIANSSPVFQNGFDGICALYGYRGSVSAMISFRPLEQPTADLRIGLDRAQRVFAVVWAEVATPASQIRAYHLDSIECLK